MSFFARLKSFISPAPSEPPEARLAAEPWCIDSATSLPDGRLSISGWAFPDRAYLGNKASGRFTINGEAPQTLIYPVSRPDVQAVFWNRSKASECGYTIQTEPLYVKGEMHIRCHDSTTPKAWEARQTIVLADPALHANLPDEDRRFRVIGNRDAAGFLRLGATDAFRIRSAFESITGKRWADVGAVLDWGVGCGRVARHLAPALGERFFGCDIDASNIEWCQSNLPGTYRASKLEPPLPFEEASFDVIYGISVFTHLRKPWELAWLKELHRVLKPGGVILMTVHGRTTVDYSGLNEAIQTELLAKIEAEGLLVGSDNTQLDGFVEQPREYVNVYHAKHHVQSVWGGFFEDIQQLEGYIFTHDLVVARKRP
jgi:SAM-dependent methyltransferase